VGGLATSPVFSSSYSAFAQEDEVSSSDKVTVSVSSGEDETEDDDYYHDKDRFVEYCEMLDEEKREFLAKHHDTVEELKEKLDRFCAMSDEEREEYHKEYKEKTNT